MRSVHTFDWASARRWAAHLARQPLPEAAAQHVRDILETTSGSSSRRRTPGTARPAALRAWLSYDAPTLLAEVQTLLHAAPPAHLDPYTDLLLPGCAFAACREGQLPLAAALLELMLHWKLDSPPVHELADFLAFQQRPEGSCGYLDPLKPSPYARDTLHLDFYLPVTRAITRALAAYDACTAGAPE